MGSKQEVELVMSPPAGIEENVRIAEWRQNASPLRENNYQHLKRLLGGKRPVLAVAALILIPFLVFWPFLALAIFFLALASGMGRSTLRASPQTASMMDLPPTPGQFPVTISLSHNKVGYGSDSGILTVLEDGLLFTGERTDFSLTRENAELDGLYIQSGFSKRRYSLALSADSTLQTLSKVLGPAANQAKRPFFVISFRADAFEGSLSILLHADTPLGATLHTRELDRVLCRWNEQPPGEAWKVTLFPPVTPQPGWLGTLLKTLGIANVLLLTTLAALVKILTAFLPQVVFPVSVISVVFWVALQGYAIPRTLRMLRILKGMEARGGD